jgi:hypothetical protein
MKKAPRPPRGKNDACILPQRHIKVNRDVASALALLGLSIVGTVLFILILEVVL